MSWEKNTKQPLTELGGGRGGWSLISTFEQNINSTHFRLQPLNFTDILWYLTYKIWNPCLFVLLTCERYYCQQNTSVYMRWEMRTTNEILVWKENEKEFQWTILSNRNCLLFLACRKLGQSQAFLFSFQQLEKTVLINYTIQKGALLLKRGS